MSDDRLKLPPVRDFGFYQRRKHDAWRPVEPPELEYPVADSHAHVHMLPDPGWELARCAANGVDYVCMIFDPSEDGMLPLYDLNAWRVACDRELRSDQAIMLADDRRCVPDVSVAAGVHPHNARLFDEDVLATLEYILDDPRVVALGEIGLDYHYDLSPRDVQREVFREQIRLAKERNLPVALHLRGGDDPELDNAHAEAFAILSDEGFPAQGTLLHCCSLAPEDLAPWVEADCYVAFGGALTFKNAEAAREGARTVPLERLLVETDAPYMTPEPMRGAACTPAHVVFTAALLAEVRGFAPGEERATFLRQLHENVYALLKPRSARES